MKSVFYLFLEATPDESDGFQFQHKQLCPDKRNILGHGQPKETAAWCWTSHLGRGPAKNASMETTLVFPVLPTFAHLSSFAYYPYSAEPTGPKLLAYLA